MDRKPLRGRQGRTPGERESSIFFLTGGGKRESKKTTFHKGCHAGSGAGWFPCKIGQSIGDRAFFNSLLE